MAAAVALGGCSITLPVTGRVDGSDEIFLGDATGYMDGSGSLAITSSRGRACTGRFQYGSSFRSGSGTFTCDDGATGPFTFTSRGNGGAGFGRLSTGERIRFVFGEQATYAQMPF